MAHSTAADVVAALQAVADPERAQFNRRYFRTGPGEYGEGDQFLGCRVGDVRRTIKAFRLLPLDEVDALLDHPLHEVRLAGVLLLAERVPRADAAQRADVLSRYLAGLERGAIDNWDLVDASAAHVLGVLGDEALWTRLASGTLWQRRAAILATFPPLKAGDPGPSLRIAELLLDDPRRPPPQGRRLGAAGRRHPRRRAGAARVPRPLGAPDAAHHDALRPREAAG